MITEILYYFFIFYLTTLLRPADKAFGRLQSLENFSGIMPVYGIRL